MTHPQNQRCFTQATHILPASLLSVKNTDDRIKAKALVVPEVTGTDEALALVSLGIGLWMGHLAGVLTEPSLHHCQRYCDRPVTED